MIVRDKSFRIWWSVNRLGDITILLVRHKASINNIIPAIPPSNSNHSSYIPRSSSEHVWRKSLNLPPPPTINGHPPLGVCDNADSDLGTREYPAVEWGRAIAAKSGGEVEESRARERDMLIWHKISYLLPLEEESNPASKENVQLHLVGQFREVNAVTGKPLDLFRQTHRYSRLA